MADYAADKGRIYERVQRACVYNVADPETERLVREADVDGGRPRRSASRSACPASGMLGVVEDILADRAFIEERETSAAELCTIADLASPGARTSSPTPWPPPRWPARTASPRPRCATGCGPSAPTATGSPTVAEVDGVTWVDDSKATNPHAAQSSLQAYDPVVWVAGGLAKGARFDDLVHRGPRPAARRRAARARPRRDRRGAFATRARCARSSSSTAARLGRETWPPHGARRGGGRHAGPTRATRCCWLRDAPPWTCSPTTPTRGDAFAAAVRRQDRD